MLGEAATPEIVAAWTPHQIGGLHRSGISEGLGSESLGPAYVEHILEPLGMTSSTCLLREGHPLRARCVSNHVGSPGSWTRYWTPEEFAELGEVARELGFDKVSSGPLVRSSYHAAD